MVPGALRKYRHLYEAEKRTQALRLEALLQSHLDGSSTEDGAEDGSPLNQAEDADGRGWDRTSDPSRVKAYWWGIRGSASG